MFSPFGFIILILMILGTGEIIRRFPKDLREFRESNEIGEKVVIAIFWAVALLFLGGILFSLVSALLRIRGSF